MKLKTTVPKQGLSAKIRHQTVERGPVQTGKRMRICEKPERTYGPTLRGHMKPPSP